MNAWEKIKDWFVRLWERRVKIAQAQIDFAIIDRVEWGKKEHQTRIFEAPLDRKREVVNLHQQQKELLEELHYKLKTTGEQRENDFRIIEAEWREAVLELLAAILEK
jgi:hypothetical protein